MDYLGRMQLVAPLVLLLVSLFCMADSFNDQELTVTSDWLGGVASYELDSFAGQICDGTLGDCNDDNGEFMMDTEAPGRLLRRVRYDISYGALAANRVPCRPRSGRSYYTRNCYRATGPVRPYRRSCTAIT